MKKEDIKIGLKVYAYGDRGYVGEVKSLEEEYVTVQYPYGEVEDYQYPYNDIEVYDPAAIEEASYHVKEKVDRATSAFEMAFQALEEARQLAYKSGSDLWDMSYNNEIDLSDLKDVIEKNGWSVSSLRC